MHGIVKPLVIHIGWMIQRLTGRMAAIPNMDKYDHPLAIK